MLKEYAPIPTKSLFIVLGFIYFIKSYFVTLLFKNKLNIKTQIWKKRVLNYENIESFIKINTFKLDLREQLHHNSRSTMQVTIKQLF